ncbi:GntR family transcriptional regulator [Providencia vermicola]|uniref:GntR family transcriptional regulator n=2 Tax=Morganellaceae TaxID=1903414 RepID=A0AAI9I2P3_PROST|nr:MULTISPECIES: GntR family transcriptional regulator [Providencia]QIC17145.1 GntR family transcriptional regulator [Providencia vermicola]ELR5037080.1 GntR family transcriptional regulator [Providencia stuartii]ELR5121105.1 GntR family transcriptional regulator [Providencia stuartii]ELR5142267.1 GntR family transcriptional regulator [Providencia stuartii]MTB38983.1 FCD domain-containing protein [Providencia sp. wls1949]
MDSSHSLKINNVPLTLREIALEKIRQAIISGYFKAGDRLVERSLCEELGVSRSIVREVLRYLESEGLIEILAKKGPIVAMLNWQQAEQIYNIRILLEQEAAKACAEKATAQDKKILLDKLQKIDDASLSQDDFKSITASTEFYETLFSIATHSIAWEIVQRLNSRISRLRAMTLKTKDRKITGFERMKRIYSAIEKNDGEAAKTAVVEHLTEASIIAKSILEKQEK